MIPGIGNANGKQLISYIGNIGDIFNVNRKELNKIPGLREHTLHSILNKETFREAEKILNESSKMGISILHFTDADYPDSLKNILDSPNILYCKGNINLNAMYSISIVGTRNATAYGESIINQIINSLVHLKPTIYSGLAYGIDILAHKSALKSNVPTVAALAGGLDKIYPGIHSKVVNSMLQNGGGIISEHPPGTKPEAHQFPARNRIIAGISNATIVVEAAKKGGALITAEIADSYNKPVFAVPGNIGNTYSEGCNNLIQSQKALIYTTIEDVLTHLNWDLDPEIHRRRELILSDLNDEEKAIVKLLQQNREAIAIDELSWRSQVQINKLANTLLQLEFKGAVKSLPGNRYQIY